MRPAYGQAEAGMPGQLKCHQLSTCPLPACSMATADEGGAAPSGCSTAAPARGEAAQCLAAKDALKARMPTAVHAARVGSRVIGDG